jgi:hypothetical protein
MLRIFQKYRKKFWAGKGGQKYILYAVGEIFLVVIGILIALQVNNWNEMRKAHDISNETISNLKIELVEAKNSMERANQVNERIFRESELYLNGQFDLDSLEINSGRIFWLTNNAPVTLDFPILQRELSSENLITGHSKLKSNLREIFRQYQSSQSIRDLSGEFWNNQIVPYYIKTGTMVDANCYFLGKEFDTAAVEGLLNEVEFKNLVAMTNLGQYQLVNHYDRLIRLFNETIQMIDSNK